MPVVEAGVHERGKRHEQGVAGGGVSVEKWRWYWNRLRRMSAGEMLFRGRRACVAQLERYGLLRPASIPEVRLEHDTIWGLPKRDLFAAAAYCETADGIIAGKGRVFALEYAYGGMAQDWNMDPKTGIRAPLRFSKTIDYRDDNLVGDIKYLWEVNRHLQLVTVAQAYWITGERRYGAWLLTQLESWFGQCPYLQGANWTSALEAAIRLINWSLVWRLIGGAQSELFREQGGPELRDRWLASIYEHAYFIRHNLSGYSSANNHLIGECSGLFVASITWPLWDEIKEWGKIAREKLIEEALQQNASDGVNKEQAIAYQQFVLDFMIIACLAARGRGQEFPREYWQRIERMLEYVASVLDVKGNMPMIGDADDGYAVRLSPEPAFCPYRSLLATGAVLFKRSDFKTKAGRLDDKTRWLLGAEADKFYALEQAAGSLPVRKAFPEGGYYILGGDFETDDEVRMIVDAGPLGYQSIAAHGHADALSVTLSVGGLEFLIDPGTYAYHTERRWRDYFRGTAAHNTARIDGQDQSVIGGSFLWLQHARAWCEEWASTAQEDRFSGSHDGYMRLRDPVLHQREIRYDKGHRLISIVDSFACKGEHNVELFWHFSEECAVRYVDGRVVAKCGDRQIVIRPVEGVSAVAVVKGDTTLPAGWISRRFDVKVPTTTVIWRARISGPAVLRTEIDCSLMSVHNNEKSGGAQLERHN